MFTLGFVSGLGQSLSKFKNSSSKTPVHPHRRSRSVKAELMRNKDKYHLENNGVDRKGNNNPFMNLHLYMDHFLDTRI